MKVFSTIAPRRRPGAGAPEDASALARAEAAGLRHRLIDDPDGRGLAALVLPAEDDALVVWSVAVAPAARGEVAGAPAFAEPAARRTGRRRRLFTNEKLTENLVVSQFEIRGP